MNCDSQKVASALFMLVSFLTQGNQLRRFVVFEDAMTLARRGGQSTLCGCVDLTLGPATGTVRWLDDAWRVCFVWLKSLASDLRA